MLTTFAILVGLLAPNTATIAIDAQPKPSLVEVDGRKVQMRLGKITVKAGKHKITVHRSGYMSQSRYVSASVGKTAKVKFRLVKKGTKSPAAKKPGAKKPAMKKPAVKKPAAKKPAAKRPAAKKPTSGFVKRPGAKKPVAKAPISKRPAKKTPVGRKKPTTVGRKPTVAAGKRPKIKRKPTVGARPKTKPRPRTTRPSGGAVAGDTAPAPRRSRTNYKGWAVFSFVVGGAAATGGVLAGMQADDKADEFNRSVDRGDKQTFKDEAEGWSLGSNVLYGVAATGVLVGSLLWAMDDSYQASVAPLPGGGAYVGIGGTF